MVILHGGIIMRMTQDASATPDARNTSFSGAKHGQHAARQGLRSYSSRDRAMRQSMDRRMRGTRDTSTISRRHAAPSPQCKLETTAQRTLQACRLLTAATAAALAFQIAPAYAGQSTRSGGTLSIDRAWMEELLINELDTRIAKMNDDELLAAFKEVIQAKLPSNPAASTSEGPLSSLQQIPARIQAFRLQWPWQQAPPTADSSTVSMLSNLLQKGVSGTNEAAAAGSSKAEAKDASLLEAESSSGEGMLNSTTAVDARPTRLGGSPNGPPRALQSSGPDKSVNSVPSSSDGQQSDRSGRQTTPEPTLRQPEKEQTDTAAFGRSKKLQPGWSGEKEPSLASDEGADETGSLLDAFGLPLQLQEDNLPEIAPASQPERPGVNAVGSALPSAGAAASGAVAALAASLKGLLSNPRDPVQTPLSNIPETVGLVAVASGISGGLYLLTRNWRGSGEAQQANPTPVGQQQGSGAPKPQVPTEAGDSSILSSAAASLQLLPHLLGFPIALTASEEVLPLPDALVDPEQAPRVASLSYKGAMLDGLQASRSLYNAQPPGNAPGQQGMDPDAAPPGPPASDPGVLWQRSGPQPESSADPAVPASAAPAEAGADGPVLWRRAEAGAPASLTFPGARKESRQESQAAVGQDSRSIGQAQAQRHVRRASALLDNVAPAAAVLPSRPPARQHASGSRSQPAASSAYPEAAAQSSGNPTFAADLGFREEDPWRAPRDGLGQANVATGSNSVEHWIAVHHMLQDRGEDPWKDEQHGTVGESLPGFSTATSTAPDSRMMRGASRLYAQGGKQSRESNGNGSSIKHNGSAGMRGLYDNVEMSRK